MSGNTVPCMLCRDTAWCTKNGCRMEHPQHRKPPEPGSVNTAISRKNVIELSDCRPPVFYAIHIEQRWDGSYALTVLDVSDDKRSKEAVRDLLLRIAEDIKSGELFA